MYKVLQVGPFNEDLLRSVPRLHQHMWTSLETDGKHPCYFWCTVNRCEKKLVKFNLSGDFFCELTNNDDFPFSVHANVPDKIPF